MQKFIFCLMFAFLSLGLFADEKDEKKESPPLITFTPNIPAARWFGSHPGSDHSEAAADGDHHLSPEEFAKKQKAVEKFWKERRDSGKPITKADVVKLYDTAGDFHVVHSLLGEVILPDESRSIGQLRAEIHDEVLQNLAKSKKFGSRFGVNDFGSGADMSKVDAKTDIDFTGFSEDQNVKGSEIVSAYKDEFRKVTGNYGTAVNPGQMDIVAHKYEATIPDWRQDSGVANFEVKIRQAYELLRNNPEAYFLEGAYVQQVMGRSGDPNAKTWTWYEPDASGKVVKTSLNATQASPFFYRPDTAERYAWGGSVGNWHFFHAHSSDIAAQAKYLLRSIDDGAGLLLKDKKAKFEKLSPEERTKMVRELYGNKVSPAAVEYISAVLETAIQMRNLKDAKKLNLGSTAGQLEAFGPLVELERRNALGANIDEKTLIELAQKNFSQYGNQLLLENNIMSAKARLTDWLAPPLKVGGALEYVDKDGVRKKVAITQDTVTRLQYSAFFGLYEGLILMDQATINKIKASNPKFARDIEIVEGIMKKRRDMAFAPDDMKPEEAWKFRETLTQEVVKDYQRLFESLKQSGKVGVLKEGAQIIKERGIQAFEKSQQFETWMHTTILEGMTNRLGGKLPAQYGGPLKMAFKELRGATTAAGEKFGEGAMLGFCAANSVMEVLKTYVREGAWNEKVWDQARREMMNYVPGMNTFGAIEGKLIGVSTLVLTYVIPGYGQALVVLHFVKNGVELAGMTVLEPLKQDRILLAYQGYLDPTPGGIFSSGQKERVISPRPALLSVVDPEGKLSMDERRYKMYEYFHAQIAEAIKKYTVGEVPDEFDDYREWHKKEEQFLPSVIKMYVNDWWDAKGVFASADVNVVHRGDDIRPELINKLIDDYLKGKAISIERKKKLYDQRQMNLTNQFAGIAANDVAIEEGKKALQESFMANGDAIEAFVLDDMPVIKPAIEIIALPRLVERSKSDDEKSTDKMLVSDRMNMRARIYGSFKDNPAPWKVKWVMSPSGGAAKTFDGVGHQEAESKPGSIEITAMAVDGEGKEFAKTSMTLSVEAKKIDKKKDDDDKDKKDKEALDAANAILKQLEAAAASSAADANQAVGDCQKAQETLQGVNGKLDEAIQALPGIKTSITNLKNTLEKIKREIKEAEQINKDLTKIGQQLPGINSTVEAQTLIVCEKSLAILNVQTQAEKDTLVKEMNEAFQKADAQQKLAASLKAQAVELVKKIKESVQHAKDFNNQIRTTQETFTKLVENQQEVPNNLTSSGELLKDGDDKTKNIEKTFVKGNDLATKGKDTLSALVSKNDAAKDILQKIGNQVAVIQSSKQRVANCPDKVKGTFEEAQKKQENLNSDVQKSSTELDKITKEYTDEKFQKSIETLSADADAALDTIDVYISNINENMKNANTCLNYGIKNSKQAIAVKVPNVLHKPVNEALGLLSAAKLIGATSDGSNAPSKDLVKTVESQSPGPNADAKENDTVTLKVYKNFMRKVPNVVKMKAEAAATAISAAGLKPNKVDGQAAAEEAAENQVYQQSPGAETEVPDGDTVNFTVYGKKKVDAPAPVPAPGPGESRETFYVVYDLYIPDIDMKGVKPEEQKSFLSSRTTGNTSFKSSGIPFLVEITGDALKYYNKEMFSAQAENATPFNIKSKNKTTNQPENYDAALLFKVNKVYSSKNDALKAFPTLADSIEKKKYISISSGDGKFKNEVVEKDNSYSYDGGPIEKGWSEEMKRKELELFKQIFMSFQCFIATTVYEFMPVPQLHTFRTFRDKVLNTTRAGSRLVEKYYEYSPYFVSKVQEYPVIRNWLKPTFNWLAKLIDDIDWDEETAKQPIHIFIRWIDYFLRGEEQAVKVISPSWSDPK